MFRYSYQNLQIFKKRHFFKVIIKCKISNTICFLDINLFLSSELQITLSFNYLFDKTNSRIKISYKLFFVPKPKHI